MPPIDSGFVKRVLHTSAVLGAGVLMLSPAWPAPVGISFAAGLAVAALIWFGAQRVGGTMGRERVSRREWAQLAVIYFGKYVVAAVVIWRLERTGWLQAPAFTAGFCLPMAVATLKALGRSTLPETAEPVPFYQQARKAAAVEE